MYRTTANRAIGLAENLEQLAYVEDKIKTTDKINRRTKAGREMTQELLSLAQEKAKTLIINGETPF